MPKKNRILWLVLPIVSIIIFGILGYIIIEHYNFRDALFMTIITITTVGFREVHPLSDIGMYFTSFLIIISFGIFAYTITALTQYIVDSVFRNYFKIKKMQKKIDKLSNHVIICGFGRNGKQALIELTMHKVPVVVIENEAAQIQQIQECQYEVLFIEGDATQDETLELAGIRRAKALIAAINSDAQNVFLTLTARELNPKLTIIAKASEEGSDIKLRRAGADNVIMPDKIGGRRMARIVAQPDVVEFVDNIIQQGDTNVLIDEIPLQNISDYLNGRALRDFESYNDTGAKIIGIKQQNKIFLVNPLPETILSNRDKLFVLGTVKQINNLKQLIAELNVHV
ncbi:MAG TPA: potassium channel protein [Bacteroidales bacterium]|nr:potassium channel protein [Bacteroidales bacterium]